MTSATGASGGSHDRFGQSTMFSSRPSIPNHRHVVCSPPRLLDSSGVICGFGLFPGLLCFGKLGSILVSIEFPVALLPIARYHLHLHLPLSSCMGPPSPRPVHPRISILPLYPRLIELSTAP